MAVQATTNANYEAVEGMVMIALAVWPTNRKAR